MKKVSPGNLAYAGVLIALNVILSRAVSIPVGQIFRISVGYVPVILAGFYLGPALGGITGCAGDLIGCLFSGYAPNVLITVSAVLTGILPALFKRFILNGKSFLRRYLRMLAVLSGTMLVTSQGFTVLGLHFVYGLPLGATFISRLPQSIFLCVVNSFLVLFIYGRIRLPGAGERGTDRS